MEFIDHNHRGDFYTTDNQVYYYSPFENKWYSYGLHNNLIEIKNSARLKLAKYIYLSEIEIRYGPEAYYKNVNLRELKSI